MRWIVKHCLNLNLVQKLAKPTWATEHWLTTLDILNSGESSCLQLPNVVFFLFFYFSGCLALFNTWRFRRWRWLINSTSRRRDRCLCFRCPHVRGAPHSGWGSRSVQKLRHAAEKLLLCLDDFPNDLWFLRMCCWNVTVNVNVISYYHVTARA